MQLLAVVVRLQAHAPLAVVDTQDILRELGIAEASEGTCREARWAFAASFQVGVAWVADSTAVEPAVDTRAAGVGSELARVPEALAGR